MNGRSILFAIWCGFTFATPALGQDMANALDLLASARERGAVTAWRSAHAAFESATNQPAHQVEAHYYAGFCSFALAVTPGVEDPIRWMNEAVSHLFRAQDIDARHAEASALLALALALGNRLDPKRCTAGFFNPGALVNRARHEEPDNPRVALIAAMWLTLNQSTVSDSHEKIRGRLSRADRLFANEAERDAPKPWGSVEHRAWRTLVLRTLDDEPRTAGIPASWADQTVLPRLFRTTANATDSKPGPP
ncbi:hypothetical protein SCOR_03130 [Sulfidibacter corallicola]|uniref:Uncharacterized protein n=1 Tax=Sulfidibacter corallicola TaxID=2818388 RepID=A0A8A4TEU4_SULCO|nr:hypothetical protein [Sulfidibacter corallicola]QTD48476.1 hypothetical protein J3U87_23095 [Sulfidibacter corallicola]